MDEFRVFQQVLECIQQPIGQRFPVIGQKSCHGISFHVLPESFDGIEIRAVGGQIDRLDVVPVQRGALVPARVVENQMDLPAFFDGTSPAITSRKAWNTSVLQ